jgi:hypothetical protein
MMTPKKQKYTLPKKGLFLNYGMDNLQIKENGLPAGTHNQFL